jgi:hypothetical protein
MAIEPSVILGGSRSSHLTLALVKCSRYRPFAVLASLVTITIAMQRIAQCVHRIGRLLARMPHASRNEPAIALHPRLWRIVQLGLLKKLIGGVSLLSAQFPVNPLPWRILHALLSLWFE